LTLSCLDCHATCTSCFGPNNTNCLSCNNETRVFIPSNYSCFLCPAKHFGNDATQKCESCHSTCKSCFGPNLTNCASCESQFYYLYKIVSACIICDLKTYGNDTVEYCVNCHPSCKTCIGSSSTDCLSCELTESFFNSTSG